MAWATYESYKIPRAHRDNYFVNSWNPERDTGVALLMPSRTEKAPRQSDGIKSTLFRFESRNQAGQVTLL